MSRASAGLSVMTGIGPDASKAVKVFFMTTKDLGKHVPLALIVVVIERHNANYEYNKTPSVSETLF